MERKNIICKKAASIVARKVFNKGPYCAKKIRKWTKCWVENGVLPVSMQDCHQKTKSFINDEDVIEESWEFIRKNKGKITLKLYKTFVHQQIYYSENLCSSANPISAQICEPAGTQYRKKL